MNRLAFAAAITLATATAAPAVADLAVGAKATDFTAPAYLAGKPFNFSLAEARKKGPVVLYFFPSAYTKGCNLEAHLFSEAADGFKAQGATLIGVTSGKLKELAAFSADTATCGGKFPVAADQDAKIAKSFDSQLKMAGVAMNMSSRTSYVIAPDGKVISTYNSMGADGHVDQTMTSLKAWRAKNPKK